MIDYNYHTHTFRCGHAFGTERQYIENAISLGIKVLGFSDHIILKDKDEESRIKFEDYIDTINKLKEEYKNKIEIHLGFEAEYIEDRVEYYKTLLKEKKVEYLILGQHYVDYKDKNDAWIGYFKNLGNQEEFAKYYLKAIKKALKLGLFTYIAHPDMVIKCFDSVTKKYLRFARKICVLAKKYNTPLEINLNGLKNKAKHPTDPTFYPNEDFFKIAGEVGNDIIIGIDAHEEDFFFKANYQYAFDLIEKYHLHHINRVNFKN